MTDNMIGLTVFFAMLLTFLLVLVAATKHSCIPSPFDGMDTPSCPGCGRALELVRVVPLDGSMPPGSTWYCRGLYHDGEEYLVVRYFADVVPDAKPEPLPEV